MSSCLFFVDNLMSVFIFLFSSRRRHTRYWRDWSSDVCSSDLGGGCGLLATNTIAQGDTREVGLEDRKSVVYGKSVDLGGRRIIKKKKKSRKKKKKKKTQISKKKTKEKKQKKLK